MRSLKRLNKELKLEALAEMQGFLNWISFSLVNPPYSDTNTYKHLQTTTENSRVEKLRIFGSWAQ